MNRNLPLVIINPAAGGGSAGRDWPQAAPAVLTHLGPFECAFTRSRGDATLIAERESRAGRKTLIAFGGDGTISEVAGGILRSGSDTELGILPHGTGADFVRTLKVPTRVADAARALREARAVRVDVGEVTYLGPDGKTESRYFVNSASFGLSGEVTESTNRSSKVLGGKISFAATTVKTAFKFVPPDIYLQVEDEPPRRMCITTVSFNNGRFFGGGMKMAPEASLVDGRLDLIVVRKVPFLKILTQGPRLYAGAHLSLPEVHHRRATSARAWPADPRARVPLEVDGENPGNLPATFEVRPGALTVRIPT